MARQIFKRFPEARQVDKETPYNERRKMGHFSWTSSQTSDQVIVNLYVVHKVCGKNTINNIISSVQTAINKVFICLPSEICIFLLSKQIIQIFHVRKKLVIYELS